MAEDGVATFKTGPPRTFLADQSLAQTSRRGAAGGHRGSGPLPSRFRCALDTKGGYRLAGRVFRLRDAATAHLVSRSSIVRVGCDAHERSMELLLGVIGLALAWTTFRVGRDTARQGELASARGLLTAVYRGIVGHAEGAPGWARAAFSQQYDDAVAMTRARLAATGVRQGVLDHVFVVPTESLRLLSTAAPQRGFISERTVAAANLALWRVHIFNQLVTAQSDFNVRHLAEVVDASLPRERRELLAGSAEKLSFLIHRSGIGDANAPDGWYRELDRAIWRDIELLRSREKAPWWRRASREPAFAAADLLILLGLLAAGIAALA